MRSRNGKAGKAERGTASDRTTDRTAHGKNNSGEITEAIIKEEEGKGEEEQDTENIRESDGEEEERSKGRKRNTRKERKLQRIKLKAKELERAKTNPKRIRMNLGLEDLKEIAKQKCDGKGEKQEVRRYSATF